MASTCGIPGVRKRPKAVVVVAGFLFAATGIAVLVGLSLLFPNRLTERMWELNKPGEALFRSIGRVSGLFLLALAVGTCNGARGLLCGKRWAWWFAVVLFVVDGTGDVVSYFVTGQLIRTIFGAVVSGLFLVTLLSRPVREYFLTTA